MGPHALAPAIRSPQETFELSCARMEKFHDGDGFAMWAEELCAAFEARWQLGTRQRVWYEVLYCTRLRRGDAVRVRRPHVKNMRGMIRAQKNGETAYFVMSDRLQAALDAGPIGDVTWIPIDRKRCSSRLAAFFRPRSSITRSTSPSTSAAASSRR